MKDPVSKIKISATNRVDNVVVLTLCELLVFGECYVPGTWGLDCNQTCPEDCDTLCHPENGTCALCLGCGTEDLASVPDATIVTFPTQTTTEWLTDSNDTTCNADINIQSLNISWNTSYPFTWIRFILKDATLKLNFNLTFGTKWTPLINCDRQEIFDLDGETVDYVCDVKETIQELTVTGAGLKSLCSFYISGGRNIALKEDAAQSTNYSYEARGYASSAVDGGTDGEFLNGSCTHTLHEDVSPSWTLTLSTAKVISRYILYNRGDCCQSRLQYFKLETFDAKNNVLWWYQDKREILNVYTVTSIMKDPVSKIKISATNRVDNVVVLTLCELLVFGECVPGTWGLDCNQTCPEECDTLCHPENGTCALCLGCGTECDKGRWGEYCKKNCKEHCYDKVCDRATGYCTNGCNGYSDPPYCSKECLPGSWGHNCNNVCTHCYDDSCDKFTGACDKGCKPPKCTEAIKQPETNAMSFEAGVGIGIAIGTVGVLVTVVVMVILQRGKNRKNQQSSEREKESELNEFTEYKLLG
ncbi:hypothetical protein Btru_066168 [Bulinus truncatus]|nr:hypothetical protein Btru_066168 [Bulinus truncatus]